MDGSLVTESVKHAFAHTKQLLFERFDLGRWLKLGFIAMLGGAVWRGGGGFSGSGPNVPVGGGEEGGAGEVVSDLLSALSSALDFARDHIGELIVLVVGLGLLWVVCVLLALYIRCVFRFIFVDSVAARSEPSIRASWGRHCAQGWSLLGWLIVMGLVPLALIVIALVPIVTSGALIASGEALSAVLGVGGIVAVMAAFFAAILMLAIVQSLTDDFLVPAMYASGDGVVASWRHIFAAWRGHLWTVVTFYLLKFLLGLGAAIVAGLVMLPMLLLMLFSLGGAAALVGGAFALGLSGKTVAILLAVPLATAAMLAILVWAYLIQCVLLPVTVFFQAYSLSFIGRLDAQLKTI